MIICTTLPKESGEGEERRRFLEGITITHSSLYLSSWSSDNNLTPLSVYNADCDYDNNHDIRLPTQLPD